MQTRKGFTLIELMIVIAIIAAIAIPNLIAARKHGNEASAIGALKTIATSEAIFREGDKEKDGNLDYGLLTELSNTNLIDSVLGNGTKQGYFFRAIYSVTTSDFLWFASAGPTVAGSTGDRGFLTNQDGVIFYTTDLNTPIPPNLVFDCKIPSPPFIPTGK